MVSQKPRGAHMESRAVTGLVFRRISGHGVKPLDSGLASQPSSAWFKKETRMIPRTTGLMWLTKGLEVAK